jgi:hypothetical protein
MGIQSGWTRGQISATERFNLAEIAEGLQEAIEVSSESKASFAAGLKDDTLNNPAAQALKQKDKKIEARAKTTREQLAGKSKVNLPVKELKELAQQFQGRQQNQNLDPDRLVSLRQELETAGADSKAILALVKRYYPDAVDADTALEFLLKSTELGGDAANNPEMQQLRAKIMEAQNSHSQELRKIAAARAEVESPAVEEIEAHQSIESEDAISIVKEMTERYHNDYNRVSHDLKAELKALGGKLREGELDPGMWARIKRARELVKIPRAREFFEHQMHRTGQELEKDPLYNDRL